MKRFTLTLSIFCAVFALAYAGETYSGKDKEVLQPAPPACDWYRAHEWDLNIWGAFAFSANTGHIDSPRHELNSDFDPEPEPGRPSIQKDDGAYGNDRFINRDNSWAGGADVKFFFSKYWALGAEGLIVDANDNIGGAGLGTFTFRYPIGCSRFAPYAWAGFGAISGGSHSIYLFNEEHIPPGEVGEEENDVEFHSTKTIKNAHTLAIGQFGGGLEVRITRHVGVMSDFSWNVVQDGNNDFGLARFGVTLSY